MDVLPDFAHRRRRNRLLSIAASFAGALSRSLWSGEIFSVYVYLLTGSSTRVGVLMGLRGIAQLTLTLPFGWLADVGRRESALRIGAALGALGAALVSLAAHLESVPLLCVSQLVWGAHWAAANPSADALFADSIDAGGRSVWFTTKYQMIQLAGIVGPTLSILVFAAQGDEWRKPLCVLVLDIGCVVALVPCVLLLLLKDVRTHPRGLRTPLLDAPSAKPLAVAPFVPAHAPDAKRCCDGALLLAPALVLMYDVISALSSGLVIKFFPIFFVKDLGLSPVHVCALGIFAMATVAAFGWVATALAARAGRVQAAFGLRLGGILSFVVMAALASAHAPVFVVIAAYLLRMGLINCTFGLTKSIIHDVVPPSQRARYASVDSINAATWAGSAALGGLLIDKYGMVATFYVTAFFSALALVPIWTARRLVPAETPDAGPALLVA